MKLSTLILAFFLPTAASQAAKFAASWETAPVTLIDIGTAENGEEMGGELLASIKPPGGKSLLIGLSGVVNIVTITEASGRNKQGKATATAEAGVDLMVKVVESSDATAAAVCSDADAGIMAAPGVVTLASRRQELSVDVDLDIVCKKDTAIDGCELTAADLEIEGSVTVALGLDTTAAHHFNFVTANLDSGTTYDVVACFTGSGETLTNNEDGSAAAKLAISSRMLTVQQVQAIQNSDEEWNLGGGSLRKLRN